MSRIPDYEHLQHREPQSRNDDGRHSLVFKWALGVAQGVILAALAFIGSQALSMHDDILTMKLEIQQVAPISSAVQSNNIVIRQLDYRMSALEARQDGDDARHAKDDERMRRAGGRL